jgi:hypothetical protein
MLFFSLFLLLLVPAVRLEFVDAEPTVRLEPVDEEVKTATLFGGWSYVNDSVHCMSVCAHPGCYHPEG